MKVTRTTTVAFLAGGVVATAVVWAYRDYHTWLALGPGGLPANLRGWLTTSWLRLHKRDPLTTDRYATQLGAPDVDAYLGDLPQRPGARPTIGVHPVPHRQLDQLSDDSVKRMLAERFDAVVARRSELVAYHLSFFEKRHPAVTLRQPAQGHVHAQATHGEIGHIHPSDGSMHMVLSTRDATTVIAAGWGERHPLAGVMLGLPDTYLLIYPPRDAAELRVTERILEAAVAHMARLPGAAGSAPADAADGADAGTAVRGTCST